MKIPAKEALLTASRLREVLTYDLLSGEFRRVVSRGRASRGDIAGAKDKRGYTRISVDNSDYLAHRLAWLYVHGEWPEFDIDHRDGVESNNAFKNLRPATHQQNMQNQKIRKNNRSRYPGVWYSEKRKKFHVSIKTLGKKIHVGSFVQFDDAVEARKAAKAQHHKFNPTDRF